MSSKGWQSERWRLVAWLLLSVAFGLVLGSLLAFFALGCATYLLWHFRQLRVLDDWLQKSNGLSSPPHLVGVSDDILSYFLRANRQSALKHERMHQMVENFQKSAQTLPDPTLILDDTHRIVWLNRAACETFDLRHPEDVGLHFLNLVRSTELADFIQKGDIKSSITISSPIQEDKYLNVRKSEYGERGQLVTARDITALMKADKMRRDFVSNASHELKTPLTVLVGYLEMLDSEPTIEEDLKPLIQAANEQANRMHKLVEDLLNLARVEHQPVRLERINVSGMLNSIAEDAKLLSGYQNHQLVLNVDESLVFEGDFNHIQSAFSNLVYNAVLHTPPNTRIEVSWQQDGDQAVFSVKDYGQGIEEKHVLRLTERFYRVQKGRERSDQAASQGTGTGLGLAIVKHVVSAHQGALDIQSKEGEGTVFTCRFPIL